MQRPPESLKEVSAAFSSSLGAAKDLAEVQAALYEHRKRAAQTVMTPAPPSTLLRDDVQQKNTIGPIAVWQPTWRDGELFFVRPPEADLWCFWADVDELPPKRNGKRVVLFGESVARALLLDPQFNVARALRGLLDFVGHRDIEVVDLARSGLTFSGLETLLAPALALEPDAYILFAGNNWHIPQPNLINFPELIKTLVENQSWASIKHYFEDLVKEQVTAFIHRLGNFSAKHKVPIIFIIPEFNLNDWQQEYTWQNPLSTGDLNLKRSRLIAEARAALADDEVERAMTYARELIALDEGTHPAGIDLMSECCLRLSDHVGARKFKEEVRDLSLLYPNLRAAHCSRITQNALRQEGPACGITIVDLPLHFAESNPEALPDRHLFFDHVHMTVEGLRVTAALTVEKLLSLLGRPGVSWSELNQFDFQVDPYVQARAYFGAACGNGAQGQTKTLAFHCREALRHDPRIADVMRAFLEIHRPNPIKYTSHFEDVLGYEGFRCLKFLVRPFVNLRDRLIFPELLQAIAEALSPEVKEELEAQIRREYGLKREGIDLLRGPFVDLTHAPLESQWWDETGYIRSYQPEARFRVIHQQPCATRLRLTYRVGAEKTMEKAVRLRFNDRVLAELPAATHWQTWEGQIPAHLARSGINSLSVIWPELCLTKEERVAELIKHLQLAATGASVKEIYLTYGEIHDNWVYPEMPSA